MKQGKNTGQLLSNLVCIKNGKKENGNIRVYIHSHMGLSIKWKMPELLTWVVTGFSLMAINHVNNYLQMLVYLCQKTPPFFPQLKNASVIVFIRPRLEQSHTRHAKQVGPTCCNTMQNLWPIQCLTPDRRIEGLQILHCTMNVFLITPIKYADNRKYTYMPHHC